MIGDIKERRFLKVKEALRIPKATDDPQACLGVRRR